MVTYVQYWSSKIGNEQQQQQQQEELSRTKLLWQELKINFCGRIQVNE